MKVCKHFSFPPALARTSNPTNHNPAPRVVCHTITLTHTHTRRIIYVASTTDRLHSRHGLDRYSRTSQYRDALKGRPKSGQLPSLSHAGSTPGRRPTSSRLPLGLAPQRRIRVAKYKSGFSRRENKFLYSHGVSTFRDAATPPKGGAWRRLNLKKSRTASVPLDSKRKISRYASSRGPTRASFLYLASYKDFQERDPVSEARIIEKRFSL